MTPYFTADNITLYHADAREVFPALCPGACVLVTDPPYGLGYRSGKQRKAGNARSIEGDLSTEVRDTILRMWGDRPALVFGTRKTPRPADTRMVLIWDKGGALGMGDLTLPWKPDHKEIYVLGHGFHGRRDEGSVLRCSPEQSMGRLHPHAKPVSLMTRLLAKCPTGVVIDPFCGSGSTLRAALELQRPAIGIETDERYCEITAKRLAQRVLPFQEHPALRRGDVVPFARPTADAMADAFHEYVKEGP